jgi:hypothetical protein
VRQGQDGNRDNEGYPEPFLEIFDPMSMMVPAAGSPLSAARFMTVMPGVQSTSRLLHRPMACMYFMTFYLLFHVAMLFHNAYPVAACLFPLGFSFMSPSRVKLRIEWIMHTVIIAIRRPEWAIKFSLQIRVIRIATGKSTRVHLARLLHVLKYLLQ